MFKKTVSITAVAGLTLALAACGTSEPDEAAYLEAFGTEVLSAPELMEGMANTYLQWGYDHCEARSNGLSNEHLIGIYEQIMTTWFQEDAAQTFIDISEEHLCVEL